MDTVHRKDPSPHLTHQLPYPPTTHQLPTIVQPNISNPRAKILDLGPLLEWYSRSDSLEIRIQTTQLLVHRLCLRIFSLQSWTCSRPPEAWIPQRFVRRENKRFPSTGASWRLNQRLVGSGASCIHSWEACHSKRAAGCVQRPTRIINCHLCPSGTNLKTN